MKCHCPHCGNEDNAGITHPISIALIGGASAGKTTFKVAFLKDFLDEEIVNYNIDFEFPSDEYEDEFKKLRVIIVDCQFQQQNVVLSTI